MTPNASEMSTRSSFAALRHPAFRWFTFAGTLWMMADNVEHVISYWVIHEQFHSPALGGYAVASHWLPFLLGGVYVGTLADRFDCRKLFLVSMGLFMSVSLGWAYVFFTGTIQAWHAILFLTIHGIAAAVFMPASQLIIHDIVGNAQLTSAVRLTATSRQVGLVLGPAVGGFLLLVLGPALGMAVNALSYVPLIIWSITQPYTGHGDLDDSVRRARRLEWSPASAAETVRGAASNRTIMAMLLVAGLTSLLVGNAHLAQMPAFAEELAGAGDGVVYSTLLLAGAVGAIFGGLVQETLPLFIPTPSKATIIATLWAAAMFLFALAPTYGVALLALFLAGILQISFMSMAQAIVQLEAPVERRGRIMGVFNMAANGLRVGSGISVGFIGAVVGIHWSLGISAGLLFIVLVVLLVGLLRHPSAQTPSP